MQEGPGQIQNSKPYLIDGAKISAYDTQNQGGTGPVDWHESNFAEYLLSESSTFSTYVSESSVKLEEIALDNAGDSIISLTLTEKFLSRNRKPSRITTKLAYNGREFLVIQQGLLEENERSVTVTLERPGKKEKYGKFAITAAEMLVIEYESRYQQQMSYTRLEDLIATQLANWTNRQIA
ncbi:hypothetical protein HYU18_01495 [Candidatus Woesearchaeota archaeon]|nr:hypothetical protein [Candidatus Woesearchaeota archaeon]